MQLFCLQPFDTVGVVTGSL